MTNPLSLLIGWLLDLLLGDPARLPHPVVWFGRLIAFGEHRLNKGTYRKAKGALMAICLILLVFTVTVLIRHCLSILNFSISQFLNLSILNFFDAIAIFYCLAGTTLIREVREVFLALDRSLEEGRAQVARIVGRDTSQLSAQEVRTAALETLAENLSDGVIAPLFWLALLGTPGMLAYKMVNTLDSMIGYKTERYRDFGCWAAHIDDIANYIPARLTALLMIIVPIHPPTGVHSQSVPPPTGVHSQSVPPPTGGVRGGLSKLHFVRRNGRNHASPNSGYPEAALAGILDCRFGGPHYYFGELFDKPYIGTNDRPLTTADMKKAVRINRTAEVIMVVMVLVSLLVVRSIW
ncbi:MAG: cobalamin biosynthesis protein CobD [Prevotella sp.]|nr:cobalamin biosynthesis protein CobD [Prevotella sp.]